MTQTIPAQLKNIHPFAHYADRVLAGQTLLPDTPENVIEVMGALDSYGIVLDFYSINLNHIADKQFLNLFPVFKYFDGDIQPAKMWRHFFHDRINYEYAEYTMKAMMWHGGGGLDAYLDTDEFRANCQAAIAAKIKYNPVLQVFHRVFPEFLIEQIRQLSYYSGLGQFWRVMSDIFTSLAARYRNGEIQHIPQIVEHIKDGLVADAARPITYSVEIGGETYDILPPAAGLTFLADTGIPYVESIFFRGAPFLGTVSYNAQAQQISPDQSRFTYGALYADPLPIGGSGIPPTLLMQDMFRHMPDYLEEHYMQTVRRLGDVRVKICASFQRSMFCVTNAALIGLLPKGADATAPEDIEENREFLLGWMDRLATSQLETVQTNPLGSK
ncbi:MAG: CO2 hydration protein [Cyanobacteria bacterium P01_D01_bin.156]